MDKQILKQFFQKCIELHVFVLYYNNKFKCFNKITTIMTMLFCINKFCLQI